jgi:hypothetical protein
MRTSSFRGWAIGLLLGLSAVPAWAGSLPDGVYRLAPAATFQRGCFPPCACPVWQAGDLRGTFRLRFTGRDLWYDNYVVEQVNWIADVSGADVRITGSGTYHIGGDFALTHRLELDLWVDDQSKAHFDSGEVLYGSSKPEIDIVVSINGVFCFDTVLHVVAGAVPWSEVAPYVLSQGSEYDEGCWPPCDCLPPVPRGVQGRFALVPLQATPFLSEYALIDVDWLVGEGPPPTDPHVTGAGFYRIFGEVAVQQELLLTVRFGPSDPMRFQSGRVPGGGTFPLIDIAVSQNGFSCYDRAFFIRAHPVVVVPGDMNCDGKVDFRDISPFVLALADPPVYGARYPQCDLRSADCNHDGVVDFRDINPFVALLSGGG